MRGWKMESAKSAAGFREGIMMGMRFKVGFEEQKWRGKLVGRPFQVEAED